MPDCSIAMAEGSDAARQVSQLVLLDSNFSALPSVVMEGRRVVNNIGRTASLYLVKTIFSLLLPFVTLLGGIPYPFTPIQLTLANMTMEAIPSFFLAFEPSRERIKGSFLSGILYKAAPCAVAIVLNVVLVHLFAPLLGLSELAVTTLHFYLTASPGLCCSSASAVPSISCGAGCVSPWGSPIL